MAQKLVIVGGGPAATNAIESIRQFDSESSITMLCDEPAHSRMALPYWLSGQIPKEQTYTSDDAAFRQLNVEPRIGVRATELDIGNNLLTLSDASRLEFDQLLIATGSTPMDLPVPGADLPGVHHLWRISDTERVLSDAAKFKTPRVVMIGAGFIGFIMLNAMFKRGWNLTVIEREAHVLPRMLNADAANVVHNWLRHRNISALVGSSVQAIHADEGGTKQLELADGQRIPADIVIIATGVQPDLALVADTAVQTDHGILVDDHLRTNVPAIYAGGDVAQGPNLLGGEREIHAIQTTAVDHGRVAGANMVGQDITYSGSLLMNVLDVCGLQCASFGIWNDATPDSVVISNVDESIYRSLHYRGDQLVGAIFLGRANDVGMLTDVGMVKGMIQTQTHLGEWKDYLHDNPFDIRRAFVASRVAEKLAGSTLLGRATTNRQYRFGGANARHEAGRSHRTYVNTNPS